jgi:hypothetical protein
MLWLGDFFDAVSGNPGPEDGICRSCPLRRQQNVGADELYELVGRMETSNLTLAKSEIHDIN